MLNTEAEIQDLTFPHSYDSDSILQISSMALQQYSNNGLLYLILDMSPICHIVAHELYSYGLREGKGQNFNSESTLLPFFFFIVGQVKLVLSLYKNLGSFLTTQNSTVQLGLELGQGSEVRHKSLVVNSHVISASVHRGSNRVFLSEPVIFTLRHLQVG